MPLLSLILYDIVFKVVKMWFSICLIRLGVCRYNMYMPNQVYVDMDSVVRLDA